MQSMSPAEIPTVPSVALEPVRPVSLRVSRARQQLKAWVAAVGPVVLDTYVSYPGPVPAKGKRECQMRCDYGGSALNTSRAVQAVGGVAVPIFLIGRDQLGEAMKDRLGDEFSRAQFADAYPASRQSHIRPDGVTDTTRPPLELTALPPHVSTTLADAAVTIVGPLAATDREFAAAALAAANLSIWQPSQAQLLDRPSIEKLGKRASVTVLNDDEARAATGEAEPIRAVMALIEQGCRNPVVTSVQGVVGRIDGRWVSAPAFEVTARRTSGAGDCFTGVFAWAYASGRTLDEALRLGQASAARHVSEQPPLADLDQLAAWAEAQRRVPLASHPASPALHVGRAISIAVGVAATILAIMLVL